MKHIIYSILLTLAVFSCIGVTVPKQAPDNKADYWEEPIRTSPYTFTFYYGNRSGKAFIAENMIYTAKHVVTQIFPHDLDLVIVGTSDIKGSEICRSEHKVGDMFMADEERGRIIFKLESIDGDEDMFETSEPIISGDSGSPLFCMQHGAIVGVVTKKVSNCNYGIATMFPKDPTRILAIN